MATIFDVAKYILCQKGTVSIWKLQNLCYYSQAWALVWTDKPLFDEDFKAWRNGPVCIELLQLHKNKFIVDTTLLPNANPNNLTEDEKDTINVVLKTYGDMKPYELRSQTQSEKPWRDMRVGLDDFDNGSNTITKAIMSDYYGSL